MNPRSLFVLVSALASSLPVAAQPVHGAGPGYLETLYVEWGKAYSAQNSVRVGFDPAEPAEALRRLEQGTVDFVALDAPLPVAQLAAKRLVQFPAAIGGVVPIVNLPGVVPGALRLNGPIIADIFLGRVKSWKAPAIAALNPGLPLPDLAIKVAHPAGASGLNLIFTSYLSAQSAEWKSSVGAGPNVTWPVGEAAKDSQSLVNFVQSTPGAFGYVDYGYAADSGAAKVKLMNRDGQAVAPNVLSFQAAAASAPWEQTPAFALLLVDQPGATSWPLTAPAFAVLPLSARDPQRTLDTLRFFGWAFGKASAIANDNGYVALPAPLVNLVQGAWGRQLKRADGTPIWKPGS